MAGCVAALPGLRRRRDSTSLFYELPSNASLILGDILAGFDCSDLAYGYYADEANNCAIFHVSLPYIDFGQIITRHFSFMCGEGTVFDQERFVCDFHQSALACSQSASFRKSNVYFGRVNANFLEEE
ncbi:U-scoloptoxin(01)-Cw1a-like [Homarus americanus]|uniref:U-scoloptoxin(01)-Cw1a-like n=1 Tax=Homarus americanus TaxID=6706 RepID=UPI001C45DA27|nr:U-scoloptoxin(01)-Cw1a-like [Homarus americanus]